MLTMIVKIKIFYILGGLYLYDRLDDGPRERGASQLSSDRQQKTILISIENQVGQ